MEFDDDASLGFEEKIADQLDGLVEVLDQGQCDAESLIRRNRALSQELEALKRDGGLSQREREALAAIDSLTGLYNRAEILKRVKQEKSRVDRRKSGSEACFSLLLFDVDSFHEINAGAGFQAGDRLLKRFAALIRDSVRDYDVVGRFSNDDFLALLPGASKEQSVRIAQTVISKIASWKDIPTIAAADDPGEGISCSVGICDYCGGSLAKAKAVESIVAQAEYALHRARRQGGAGFSIWGQEGRAHE